MKQIYLGTLSKPHGLKGSAFFYMENIEDTQLKAGKSIYLTTKSETKLFVIEHLNTKGKKPIIKLEGINSREELELILPADVSMDRADFEDLQEGQFYLTDMLGFEVIEYESSKSLGKVEEFYSNGAQDIVVIRGKEEIDLPLNLIEEILWEAKKIKIYKPEYL